MIDSFLLTDDYRLKASRFGCDERTLNAERQNQSAFLKASPPLQLIEYVPNGITVIDRETTVILVNSDVIDKLGFGVLPSVPFRPPLFGALRLRFRLLPEPCGAAAGNPGAPPPTRCSAALRQASETHPGG